MTDSTLSSCLAYYARHSCALFPIPRGSKSPTGIVASFAHDWSKDPEQWSAWQAEHPGCNWGLVSGPSRLIIADVDVSEIGRDRAWALWAGWWQSHGLEVPAPHVQSARGGWHTHLALPDDVDISTLRQIALIGPTDGSRKAIVDLRVGNGFVVAAGSYYDGTAKGEQSGPYLLLSDAAPYPAPAALLAHCTRAPRNATAPASVGSYDLSDMAGLVTWLAEREAFAAYEDWLSLGMALKIEAGDAGFDLWELSFDETVTSDVAQSKWDSFSSEPTAGCVTVSSWLQRAHKLGWRGTIRKSAAAMFDGVAQIAAAAGASLSSAQSGMPMMAGQQLLTELSEPIIDEFLSATSDAPLRPSADDFPTLPPSLVGHGLYNSMCDAIARIFAMTEAQGNKFKSSRCNDVLAVLNCLHVDVFDAVCRRLRANGHPLQDRKIKWAAANIAEKIERVTVTQDKWEYDRNGLPESDNSDNVVVFLGIIGVEVRWNAWLERMEIRGGTDPDLHWREWTYIDDAIVAKLRTRANRTKTRFRPGKEFFWESLLAIAHSNTIDPALDLLAELESNWDGIPRLSIWMSQVCGVTCDPYHQAVGRNIIGGMVRRLRHPGCKHDTMAVFFGFQGSGKSTLASVLALRDEWFTDTVLLGAEAKELVLALAGKSVAEIGEMGMRGSANASHVKAMLSRQVDEGRTAYARAVTARPRRNIFIGTTNEDEPLQDPTGNRRFLPVRVDQEIDLEWLRANIKQLIGEAARLETKGADFAIPRDVWGIAAEHQERARASGDMEISLHEWFGETTFTGAVNYITAHDMVKLCGLAGWRNGSHNSMRGALMKRMGFRSEKPMMNGKRTTVWVRGHCTPADIPRIGVRYVVGVDKDGQAIVSIRREAPVPT